MLTLTDIIGDWIEEHELFKGLWTVRAAHGTLLVYFGPPSSETFVDLDRWIMSIEGDGKLWGSVGIPWNVGPYINNWPISPTDPEFFIALETMLYGHLASKGSAQAPYDLFPTTVYM